MFKKIFNLLTNSVSIESNSNSNQVFKIAKLEKGIVRILNQHGSPVDSFLCGDAVSADYNMNKNLTVVLTKKGRVQVHQDHGAIVGSFIVEHIVTAKWAGDNIVVTTTKGLTQLRSQTGTIIKYSL